MVNMTTFIPDEEMSSSRSTLEDLSMAMAELTGNGSFDAAKMAAKEFWDKLPFASPYWHQFDIENTPAMYHYGVAIWMTFFGILGVLGNILVIYVFMSTKSLRTPPNILIVNLALSDMLFSAFNGFPLLTISSINRRWVWGDTWCQIYGFAGGIFGLMSINTLAAIAMDRHYVITNPLQAARTMTKKHAFINVILVWIWSFTWSSPPLFGWGGKYKPDGFQTSCTYDYVTHTMSNITFNLCMHVFSWVLPVAAIFYCYGGIVREVFKHSAKLERQASKMGATISQGDKDKKSEIQAAKVSALTVVSFMVSWTPYSIIGICGLAFPHSQKVVTPAMSEIAVMFAKASAAYNPVIYALSHPKYRAGLFKKIPCLAVLVPKRFRAETRASNMSNVSSGSTMSISMTNASKVAPNPGPEVATATT